ncbi:MAG TPA: hypothetical protein VLH86_01865 [Patescibacteria group bacterium]|nr:hypothetical protein [Patescibacteria group bacterium]
MEPTTPQTPPEQPWQQQPQPHPQYNPPTAHEPAPLWPAPGPQLPPQPQQYQQPLQSQQPAAHKPGTPNNAIDIVWQWVTYGLWEWALVALSVFLSSTLTYFFVHSASSGYEFGMYSLAAVICLLPLAIFADRMYSKREPHEKHGFAAVVLVLNAIVVFLAVVGGLITAVVSVMSWIINGQFSADTKITVISSLVVALLGGLLFARIMKFARLERILRIFPLIITAVVIVTTIFAIAGPFRSLIGTRNDRLIEANIGTVSTAIDDFTTQNNRLPASLDDLTFNQPYQDGAKNLVKKKLVTYKHDSNTGSSYYGLTYQLCATFKKAKGNPASSSKDVFSASYQHGRGEQCYDLTAYGNYKDTTTPQYPDTTQYPDSFTQ